MGAAPTKTVDRELERRVYPADVSFGRRMRQQAKPAYLPSSAVRGSNLQRQLNVCAVRRRRFPVGASPTRRTLQPEATGAVMEVTKWLKGSVRPKCSGPL